MTNLFWKECFKEAKKAFTKNEVPVGCIIVKNNIIIARGHNLKEKHKDSTAHAEIIAIKKAQKKLNDWRLIECDMYVTLEPCPMCAGAILHSRIKNVYYAAADPNWGAETKLKIFSKKHFNHQVKFQETLLKESSMLLKTFFKEKRNKKIIHK